jgi:3-dehydroquinate dehydratase-1
MADLEFDAVPAKRMVVGSFGGLDDVRAATATSVAAQCDVAELRLDLLADARPEAISGAWRQLDGAPLLFTARRGDEGGAGDLDALTRVRLLRAVLDDASCIDLEVASIDECASLLETIRERGVPWIASFHDFDSLPDFKVLENRLRQARDAGAAAFKAAARLHTPADVARLAEFQLADHGMPVATMGMGPLAAVSRLLCAQCGSVLNYGYLGDTATAPGQWSAGLLRQTIARLPPFPA